jgi:hypothetical protein
MKVATILPQNFLGMVETDNYHMCLAHLIDAPGMEVYTDFFKRHAAIPNNYVIMDNGLIEGNPRPIEELVEKAQKLGAQELILPDVFRDSHATLKAIDQAFDYISRNNVCINLMAVPQGRTLNAWISCANLIMDYPVKCLGIPKVLTDIAGRDGRANAILKLHEICPEFKHFELHLLGCWTTAIEVLTLAKLAQQGVIHPIRGVDSALSFVYARAGLRLSDDDRPDSNSINFQEASVPSKALLALNIRAWQDSGDISDKPFMVL